MRDGELTYEQQLQMMADLNVLRTKFEALSSERAAREEAEGRSHSHFVRKAKADAKAQYERALAAEAQVSALQAACYVASEPHLSGYRVILGFDTLNAAQDAHEALARARASQPPADEPAKGGE